MASRRAPGAPISVLAAATLAFAWLVRSPSADPGFEVAPLASGFNSPLHVATTGVEGDERLFVVEQTGQVRILFEPGAVLPTPFLDISPFGPGLGLTEGEGERGLLGAAFHPRYAEDGRFFVSYTRRDDGASVVASFRAFEGNPNIANPETMRVAFGPLAQPSETHNGGHIAFGPADGFLYLGLGDGGGKGDPHGKIGNGQNSASLLGKILRLDVDAEPLPELPYAIPANNPFVGAEAFRNEIYAYGLRNPWRFSFDREAPHRLFVGDVGQDSVEEIDLVEAGDNLGWRCYEGSEPFDEESCGEKEDRRAGEDDVAIVFPIHEYGHETGCSVAGGAVYRGEDHPSLRGRYFFGDFCAGAVWSLAETSPGVWARSEPAEAGFGVVEIAEDQRGELLVVNIVQGSIGRIRALPGAAPSNGVVAR